MSVHEIYNYIKISETVITSGQPTADQLQAAAAEGFTAVINLVPTQDEDALKDEAAQVQSLGMQYFHIPVVWNDPQAGDFAAFERVMAALPVGKTLIHCAANYRVTAFYSLYAQKHLGWSEAQADGLRARIWREGKYPVWEQFIRQIKAQITRPSSD